MVKNKTRNDFEKIMMEDGLHIEKNWYKRWYKDGKIHREDGPAVECPSGDKFWCKNGSLHREDGPAIIFSDGDMEYWLNGKFFITKNEWLKFKLEMILKKL